MTDSVGTQQQRDQLVQILKDNPAHPQAKEIMAAVDAFDTQEQQAVRANPRAGRDAPISGAYGPIPYPTDPEAVDASVVPFKAVGQGLRQVGQGLGQFGLEVGQAVGAVDPEETRSYNVNVAEQRQQFIAKLTEQNPQLRPDEAEKLIMMGEFLPGMAVPALRARTLWGSVFKNGLVGGGFSGAQFDAESEGLMDKAGNVALGTVAGSLVGFLPGGRVSALNSLTRPIREAVEEPAVIALRQSMDEQGIRYTLGNVTGTPALIKLEAMAIGPGRNRNTFLFQQAQDIQQSYQRLVERVAGNNTMSRQQIVSTLRTSLERSRKSLVQDRRLLWSKGMKQVEQLGGDTKLVSPKRLLAAVDEVIESVNDVRLNPGGSGVSTHFAAYRDEIAKAIESGGVTAKDLNKYLMGIEELAGGKGKVFTEGTDSVNKALAGRLRARLLDDIADAGKGPQGQHDAVKLLMAVRANYRAASTAIDEMSATATAAAFGGKKLPQGAKLQSVFNSFDPAAQKEVVKLLADSDPGALRALRADVLQTAAKDAMNFSSASVKNPFDIAKFARSVGKLRDSGLLNERQVERAMRSVSAARVALNRLESPIGSLAVLPEDVAINVVSQTPAFVARLVARLLTGRSADALLFSEAGHKALLTVAETGASSAKMTAAVGTLAGMLVSDDEVPQEQPDMGTLLQGIPLQ